MKLEQVRFRSAVQLADGRNEAVLAFRTRDGEITPLGRIYNARIDFEKRVVSLQVKTGAWAGKVLGIPLENVSSYVVEGPEPSANQSAGGPGRGHKRAAEEMRGDNAVS